MQISGPFVNNMRLSSVKKLSRGLPLVIKHRNSLKTIITGMLCEKSPFVPSYVWDQPTHSLHAENFSFTYISILTKFLDIINYVLNHFLPVLHNCVHLHLKTEEQGLLCHK